MKANFLLRLAKAKHPLLLMKHLSRIARQSSRKLIKNLKDQAQKVMLFRFIHTTK